MKPQITTIDHDSFRTPEQRKNYAAGVTHAGAENSVLTYSPTRPCQCQGCKDLRNKRRKP